MRLLALACLAVAVTAELAMICGLWRRLRAVEQRLQVEPPRESAAGKTPQDVIDDKVRRAPELFAKARQVEELRRAMACVVCAEPTAITCVRCRQRVCVTHREDHGCSSAARKPLSLGASSEDPEKEA